MAISGPSLFLEAACGSAFVPFFAPDESSETPGNMKKKGEKNLNVTCTA
jgi:hypothetical protein